MKMFLKMLVCAVVLGTINCQASNNNIINTIQNNISLQGNMNQSITDNNFTWDQMKKCASVPAINLDSEVYKKFDNFCNAYDIPYTKELVTEFLSKIYYLAHKVMYSTSEFTDEKYILGVITLPNLIKHWNLQKQFDLNPNLMQNNENKDMYSNWKLQNRNTLKEEITVSSKYTELEYIASIMNNINKELNQYATVPNPDDIPDKLGFIEAGNYIANYLVLLTNNILFKIGEKIDEYANGIEEYSFDNFRNYLEKKILIPSCKALSAFRNIMQDRFQVFSMLPPDNISKNQYTLESFLKSILSKFKYEILNSGKLSIYGSRIRYEVDKKEKEITKVLNEFRDSVKNINNQIDITSLDYWVKNWLSLVTHNNQWQYDYNIKTAEILEQNPAYNITQLSNNYLNELRNNLIFQFNKCALNSVLYKNKKYEKEIRDKFSELMVRLDKMDLRLPAYYVDGELYDYNRELRKTFNAYKDAIDNTYY